MVYNKVLFIAVAKNNLRMLKGLKDLTHVDNIYNRFFYRKKDIVVNSSNIHHIKKSFESLDHFYRDQDLIYIFPKLANKVLTVKSFIYKMYEKCIKMDSYMYNDLDKYYDIKNAVVPTSFKLHEKVLNDIISISDKNRSTLNCLRVPSYDLADNEIFCNLAKKVLVEK
jgi:hypothetical protein